MARSRRTLNDSRASDDSGDDSTGYQSPPGDVYRGRKGKPDDVQKQVDKQVDQEMEVKP